MSYWHSLGSLSHPSWQVHNRQETKCCIKGQKWLFGLPFAPLPPFIQQMSQTVVRRNDGNITSEQNWTVKTNMCNYWDIWRTTIHKNKNKVLQNHLYNAHVEEFHKTCMCTVYVFIFYVYLKQVNTIFHWETEHHSKLKESHLNYRIKKPIWIFFTWCGYTQNCTLPNVNPPLSLYVHLQYQYLCMLSPCCLH